MKKFIRFSLILIILMTFMSLKVSALTTDARMIITSPAEDMSSEINISWHTDDVSTYVEYTLATDINYAYSQIRIGECSAIPFDNMTSTSQCTANLTNLAKNTEYIYRVGRSNMSESYSFKTAGAETFSFLHATDIHSYKSGTANTRVTAANNVLNKAASIDDDIAFTFFSGDVTAYGTVYEQWETLYGMDTAKQMAYAFSAGNHDYYNTTAKVTNNSYFNSVTNNPDNGATGVESSYFFKYGNALFISLDSEAAVYSDDHLANQQQWFKEVVANNPTDFIIVAHHRPFYTGDGRNTIHTTQSREFFQELFDECGVDLVLTGHNHVYARTYQILDTEITTVPGEGTVYMTGIQIGDRYQPDPGTPMVEVAYAANGAGKDGSTLFTVSKDKIELQFISLDDSLQDTAEIISKSSTINKTTFENSLELNSVSNDFSKATLSFDDIGAGRVNKIKVTGENNTDLGSYLLPSNSLEISNIPQNAITYDLDVEITLRSGDVINKSFELLNEELYIGTLENFRVEDNSSNEACLHWDNNLVDGKIDKFEIHVNGTLLKEVEPDEVSTVLDFVSPYNANVIEFKAFNSTGDLKFTETINYGEAADTVTIDFSEDSITLEENEKSTPTYVVSPQQELDLEFSSSDEAVATVNEFGEVTAIGAGTCTITVNVSRRWDVSSSIEVTVNEYIEPTPEPDPVKKGCFGSSGTVLGLGLLGMVLIFRKRRMF